jgi:Integrase core domain
MTHWHLDAGVGCEIINIIDDYSRAVLASVAVTTATATDVVRVFFDTATSYGLPASVLSDNGAIYTAAYRGAATGLEIELAALGITFKHGKPYRPQTQGKIERYHRTLKHYLRRRPPARDLIELQAQIDRFVHLYNEERPRQARGCPPMHAWRTLDKSHPNPRRPTDPREHQSPPRQSRHHRLRHPPAPLTPSPHRDRRSASRSTSTHPRPRPRHPSHRRQRRTAPTPHPRPHPRARDTV